MAAAVNPVQVKGGGLENEHVTLIGCGGFHTFAVTSGSTMYCWGKNSVGELGLGHTNPVNEPAIHGLVKAQVWHIH